MTFMSPYHLRPMKTGDFPDICRLSDAAFGESYITTAELQRQWPLMNSGGETASFVLVSDKDEILGFRITFLPGTWFGEKEGGKCLSDQWPVPQRVVGYFKTAYVDDSLRGQGWGRKMAEKALSVIKQLGGKAVVTHSWNESPGDSSGKYLRALGFDAVGRIPGFWGEAEYDCVECNNKPCTCTATEMILELK